MEHKILKFHTLNLCWACPSRALFWGSYFQDGRLVPGGGATEIALVKELTSFGDTRPGLDQYAIKAFSAALESFPKTLAENTGVNANEVISKLYAAHEEGQKSAGFDIEVRDFLHKGSRN